MTSTPFRIMFVGMGEHATGNIATRVAMYLQKTLGFVPHPVTRNNLFSPRFVLDDFFPPYEHLNQVAIMVCKECCPTIDYDLIIETGDLKGITFSELRLEGRIDVVATNTLSPFPVCRVMKVPKGVIGSIMNTRASRVFKL